MERTLLIRHNWDERKESKWLFWLEKKLTELGFNVSMADLPEVAKRNLSAAVGEIQATHGITVQNTHIVRHDPGCLTLLKYCEELMRRGTSEPTLLVAGVPKRNYDQSPSVLKMIGGAKGLVKSSDDIAGYEPDPQDLTLDTIEVKMMVVYGGELFKALR